MEVAEHLSKAGRIERTMGKLDPGEDCETLIENCMLAGTHLVNAVLHESFDQQRDIIHSDLQAIDRTKGLAIATDFRTSPDVLRDLVSKLAAIEAVRPEYIRGPRNCSEVAQQTYQTYMDLKTQCLEKLQRR